MSIQARSGAAPRVGFGEPFKLVAALAAGIDRDLPITVALVFTRIAAAGQSGVLQATVQRELCLSPAVLTRTVQTLNASGLIARTIDNADSRHRILTLTEKGRALGERL